MTCAATGFTARERSSITGLDYFGARYFSAAQGRFTSADDPLADQFPSEPQSWNLYSYVRNNPLKFTDPSGQDCIYTNTFDPKTRTVKFERGSCTQEEGKYVAGTIDTKSASYDSNSNSLDYAFTAYKGGTYSVGSTELPDEDIRAVQRGTRMAGTVAEPLLQITLLFVQVATGAFLEAPMPQKYGPPEDSPSRATSSQSTGRTASQNLKEQLAMEQVRANPNAGTQLPLTMKDPRWPASRGWVKMRQNVNGVEVHYLKNTQTGQFADFKFR